MYFRYNLYNLSDYTYFFIVFYKFYKKNFYKMLDNLFIICYTTNIIKD